MATPIRIKRSAVPGKVPSQGALQYGELAFNLHDADLFAVRNRAGIGSEVVRIGAGASVTNIIYVTPDGNDNNTGFKLGDAKRTIRAAVGIASTLPGSVVKISPGTYVENNPIHIEEQVSLVGDSLREVTVVPQNIGDIFYVSNGNYIANISFSGSQNSGATIAFNPNKHVYINQSPYIQNCSNFIPGSIGIKIDGSNAIGPTKSIVLDSYTQYNQNGIGISITNNGYAQLVSLFTICNDIAVYASRGGSCDITNSNSSFGNYGLVADGVSEVVYTGIVTAESSGNTDTLTLDISSPNYNVINAQYDSLSGLLTAYTSQPTNIKVGMAATITGLGFTCSSDSGITTVQYPSGNYGYVFDVISNPVISGFTTSVYNVGVASATRAAAAGVYTNIIPTRLTGIGTGLKLNASVDVVGVVTFSVAGQGVGYVIGDTLSVSDSLLGGSGAQDVPLSITGIRTEYGHSCYVGVSTLQHYYTSGGNIGAFVPRPYDGQVVYVDYQYASVSRINVGSGGTGYTSTPTITIEPPLSASEWGIQATAVPEIKNGSVTAVTIVSSGRGYDLQYPPTITISSPDVGINTATLSIELEKTFYAVKETTPVVSGITTITFNDVIPYVVGVGSTVPFFRQSRILATGHSFEYIGSGTSISSALPSLGGVAIQSNEVDNRNGGLVVYTSTDQGGNFRIGEGVVIDQLTGSIGGDIYNKSLFSKMTPFILALGGE